MFKYPIKKAKHSLFRSFVLIALLITIFHSYAFAEEVGNIISLTDIHFNPFYDEILVGKLIESDYTEWDQIFSTSQIKDVNPYNEETNFILFKSALEKIHTISKDPDFILISGDLLAHSFNDRFTKYSKDPATL